MKTFSSFISKKDRDNKHHLHLLLKILKKAGFETFNHINDRDPYFYVAKPKEMDELSFGGIRFYAVGQDIICYRCQNKENTEPYGKSYHLDIEQMFRDLIKDADKKIIGYRIIFYIIKEIKNFFQESLMAERELEAEPTASSVVVNSTSGTDYANNVFNKKSRY